MDHASEARPKPDINFHWDPGGNHYKCRNSYLYLTIVGSVQAKAAVTDAMDEGDLKCVWTESQN